MIWKTILVISVAHYVLSEQEEGAVSEQRVTIHHSKSHFTDHPDGDNKSENYEEYAWAYPSYEFSYKVNDPHTHDIKGQNENRHGDEVKGIYWLLEPNGDKRTVNYNANDHIGFNAQVDYARKENENSDDNNGYSVHEEQIEDIVQNKNEENNDDTSNKEEIEEENKEDNNQKINEAAEKNQEENISEKNNDNFKENESIVTKKIWVAEEEGENVEVVRTAKFNLNEDDDDRLEHIQQQDIKRNIYKKHKEGNEKTEKYSNRNERTKRINLNNHDQINNNRGFSKQEKKIHQSKNIASHNGGHKTARKEDTTQRNENEKTFEDEDSENNSKYSQKNFDKSKSENKAATDKIYIGKLNENDSLNNDDNESQIYQHRIFINHPKFSISVSKQKKHRH